jgi:hypothetical protein
MEAPDETARARIPSDLHTVFPDTKGIVEEIRIRGLPRGFPYWAPGRRVLQNAVERPGGIVYFAGDRRRHGPRPTRGAGDPPAAGRHRGKRPKSVLTALLSYRHTISHLRILS